MAIANLQYAFIVHYKGKAGENVNCFLFLMPLHLNATAGLVVDMKTFLTHVFIITSQQLHTCTSLFNIIYFFFILLYLLILFCYIVIENDKIYYLIFLAFGYFLFQTAQEYKLGGKCCPNFNEVPWDQIFATVLRV